MSDWVAISAQPLAVDKATAFLADAGAGGIAVFLGTTRNEAGPGRRKLLALDYEAYQEMAVKQFGELARQVRERWPVVRLVILHRVGRVGLGEASVMIGVATPHRGEAFEACKWLIDTLKATATIWKKRVWSDGTSDWVAGS